ncbi:peptidoglycan D,D-transpeptidase FtsI family protein [Sulfurihydrogenibium subterraneum]|uniref:peptidoglycan D,D-transpeptidase FtsI family protein n=1 Tax=Sulfurihydrogenibium subterraneum TaxID=171121 RepID=UPI00048AC6C7|nr:penicillin-binding protein 2 [Sulfurihydrogenibium subterraneum]
MSEKKTYFILAVLSFSFLIVLGKILQIQVFEREEFQKRIERQYYQEEEIILPRGTIFDRNGKFIAISIPTLSVYVIPKYIKDKENTAKQLSLLLKIPYEELRKTLYERKNYTIIATNVDKSLRPQLEKVRFDLKEWNIGILDNSMRFYPFGFTAGNVIGFVSKKTGLGLEGMEYQLNDYLGGGKAKLRFLKDARGNLIAIEKADIQKKTYNAVLTIDMNVQHIAEESLMELVQERNPLEAAVLIMNPYTGEILAAASYPNYDPNNYQAYKYRKNIVFQHAYEVGSVAKPIFLAEAIDEKKVNLNEIIDCQNGAIYVDGVRIRDHKKFGFFTPVQIIQHSSNVGAIKIALRLDSKAVYKRLRDLGFGQKTGIFSGEASGSLKEDYRPVNIAYASIGQNWTTTVLQVGVAYSAFANGGYLVKPMLLKGLTEDSGNYVKVFQPQVVKKVLSDESIEKLKPILKLVVEDGTAKSGKSDFFTIAGKTGTAQKYDPAIKALSNTKWYTWFAGFFPVEKPMFTVVVFANEPKPKFAGEHIGGGGVSATVLKNLVDRIMFYYKQKPDKVKNSNTALSSEQQR